MNQAQSAHTQAPHSAFRIPHSAFTLIELLVVIGILGLLSALILGVAANAGERGREARTKALIARLHALVTEQYETYKDRRAPLSDGVVTAINAPSFNPRQRGPALAEARLYALRELMVMEMPDRWSDVLIKSVDDVSARTDLANPLYLKSTSSSFYIGPTPLIEAFRRQYFAMVDSGVSKQDIRANQGAECLYMIVMFATADGEARSLFNEKSIGDTDGDGAPEFIDGWGNPISFIRWAPGFESDLQANATELGSPTDQTWIDQATADHDPFDVFRREAWAFRLVPLIYSPGSDERYDLYTARDTTTWPNATSSLTAYGTRRLNPYTTVSSVDGNFYLGIAVDDTAADNIHNHNISSE